MEPDDFGRPGIGDGGGANPGVVLGGGGVIDIDGDSDSGVGAKLVPLPEKEKPVKLDAGKVRLMEQEGKKKAEKLRNSFYMSDDVQKYLGEM